MKLAYRKADRTDFSGELSCKQVMSAVVDIGKERNFDMEDIRLDVTDSLYNNNDTLMLQKELGDFSGKTFFVFYCHYEGHDKMTHGDTTRTIKSCLLLVRTSVDKPLLASSL